MNHRRDIVDRISELLDEAANTVCPGCNQIIDAHTLAMSLCSTYKGQNWHQDCAQTAYKAAKSVADARKADAKQQAVVKGHEYLRGWADSLEVRRLLGTGGVEAYGIYIKGTNTQPVSPPTLKAGKAVYGIVGGFSGPPVFQSKSEAQTVIDRWRKEAEATVAAYVKKHRLA